MFLIGTPAVMLIVDNLRALPRAMRLATIAAIAIVALEHLRSDGRIAYTIFMASSVITLCFLVEIAALVALRVHGGVAARTTRISSCGWLSY